MNEAKGGKIVGVVGKLDKVDGDEFGDVASAFLRASVVILIDEPLKHYVVLDEMNVGSTYEVQYKKFPLLYFSRGNTGDLSWTVRNH